MDRSAEEVNVGHISRLNAEHVRSRGMDEKKIISNLTSPRQGQHILISLEYHAEDSHFIPLYIRLYLLQRDCWGVYKIGKNRARLDTMKEVRRLLSFFQINGN